MRQNASAACIINCTFNVISTFFRQKSRFCRASYKWSYLRRNSLPLHIKAFLSVCVCVSIINDRASCFVVWHYFAPREFVALRTGCGACARRGRDEETEKKTIQEHVSLNSDTRIDLSVNIKHFTKEQHAGQKHFFERESFCVCWERDAEWMARRMRWGIARAPTFIYVNTHPAQRPRLTRRPTVSVVCARE